MAYNPDIDWPEWLKIFNADLEDSSEEERSRILWRAGQEFLRQEGAAYDAMVGLREAKALDAIAEDGDCTIKQQSWCSFVGKIRTGLTNYSNNDLAGKLLKTYPEAFPTPTLVFDDPTRQLNTEFDLSRFVADPRDIFPDDLRVSRPIIHYVTRLWNQGAIFGMPYEEILTHVPDAYPIKVLVYGPFFDSKTKERISLFRSFGIEYTDGEDYALMPTRTLIERTFFLKEGAKSRLRVVK